MDGFLGKLWTFCTVLGVIYLLQVALGQLCDLWGGIRTYLLSPYLGVDLRDYGPWAVVTGASEGIGRGYALELARRGLNIVLLSRSQEKLEKVATEIRDTHKKTALVIPVDFTEGQQVYETLQERLSKLEIGLLVNNVGMSHKFAQYFLEVGEQRARDMVELNFQAMVQMTHLLLPAMVKRGRGAIVNVSSYAANHPQPLLGLYSSTKKFVNVFSSALRDEYFQRGIFVQTVTPNFVSTGMTKMRRNVFVPTGIAYAKSAVSTIGVVSTTCGCLPHALVHFLYELIPGPIKSRAFFCVLSYARSRYFRLTSRKNDR